MEIRLQDLAKRYDVPDYTLRNWKKAEGTWRRKLYNHLEECYIRELAEKARWANHPIVTGDTK